MEPLENTPLDLLLIGCSDIDYVATAKKKIIAHDSNIGTVHVSLGGVMRNVAESLSRLGLNPLFLTPIGNDENGKTLIESFNSLSIKIMTPFTNFPTAIYLAVNRPNKDLDVSVIDNRIFSSLNWSYLSRIKNQVDPFQNIVFDSNLDEATISYITDIYSDRKLYIESVSVNKVVRFNKYLSNIYLYSGNYREATALLGVKKPIEEEIKALMSLGPKNVVITDGPKGAVIGSQDGIFRVPGPEVRTIVSTNGAGDAMFAGVVYCLFKGRSLKEGAELGTKLSAFVLKTQDATSPDVSRYCDY
jgi:pseudouridine kinase